MGVPETRFYQMGVCSVMCINLGVLDTKKVENH